MKLLRLFRRKSDALVEQDADVLMRAWGGAAYDHARTTAREVTQRKLIDEHRPAGHWDRVRREIGRRTGRGGRADTATRYLES